MRRKVKRGTRVTWYLASKAVVVGLELISSSLSLLLPTEKLTVLVLEWTCVALARNQSSTAICAQ
jgi:hypothetical protein